MGLLTGFFIQYKFILPNNTKHTSYTYQKLFRALYGYTQNVSKSNGKTYKYHRKGVLSSTPYFRPGKNCVIIPNTAFNSLTNFFKTGKNPTHYWRDKGDWKAVYYMDEKNLDEKDILIALEELLDRTYLTNSDEHRLNLQSEITNVSIKLHSKSKVDRAYLDALIAEAEKITSNSWFKACYGKSEKLITFFNNLKTLKNARF